MSKKLVKLLVVNLVCLRDGFEERVVLTEFSERVISEEVEELWFLVFLGLDRL
jgi:hypothetical protein